MEKALHEFMESNIEEEDEDDDILCQEFTNTGYCSNGDSCTKFHMKEGNEEEEKQSREEKCCICLEGIMQRKKRFGILENCDHAFCLDCI